MNVISTPPPQFPMKGQISEQATNPLGYKMPFPRRI